MKNLVASFVMAKAPKSIMGMLMLLCLTVNTFAQAQNAVLDVQRTRKAVTVVVANDSTKQDTTTYRRMKVSEVSDSLKMARYQARIHGQQPAGRYFDNRNRDVEGNLLTRGFIELQGGASLQFDGTEIRPEGRIVGGLETKHFLFFGDLFLSLKGYNKSEEVTENGIRKGADATGHYTTYGGTGNIGWKVWQDDRYRNYVAIYAGIGYGFSATDGSSAEAVSANSGFVYKTGVRGKWSLSKSFALTTTAEFGNVARFFHDSDQDLGNVAGRLLIGGVVTF